MKLLFDKLSNKCSQYTTNLYSTSFSFGIKALDKEIHEPIYNIYGFVRLADEIVDSFHDYNKQELFYDFKSQTIKSIKDKISLNPILNSFQKTVHEFNIEKELIETFFNSMEMDLNKQIYDEEKYKLYVLGSAEVVGLMCLRVFVTGNDERYNLLKPYAMRLGAAFQKVNFLRDANSDFKTLGRTYFPGVDMTNFDKYQKQKIENEIEDDFKEALTGIKMLPALSKGGVYLAYRYYYILFAKIKSLSSSRILEERIRVSNINKLFIMIVSMCKHKLKLI